MLCTETSAVPVYIMASFVLQVFSVVRSLHGRSYHRPTSHVYFTSVYCVQVPSLMVLSIQNSCLVGW